MPPDVLRDLHLVTYSVIGSHLGQGDRVWEISPIVRDI
jgi:hypothetical protein